MRTNSRAKVTAATLGLLMLMFAGSITVRAQSTASPLPSPTGYVNDYANVIDPATRERMETILTNLDKSQKIEFAVVTVKTTGGQDIFDYSLAVMRGWGIGSVEKPGLLLLAAIDDRKYFTQVSRHLEGDLPDSVVGSIQRQWLVPAFKEGMYSDGLMATMQAFVATLAEKRGFSVEGLDQRYAYKAAPQQRRSSGSISPCAVVFIIFIIIIIVLSSRGRGGGCLSLFLLGSLFSNRGGGSSGWSGGGGFGGSGGGDGGFGGFSGGGGDAGGGGAGGSW